MSYAALMCTNALGFGILASSLDINYAGSSGGRVALQKIRRKITTRTVIFFSYFSFYGTVFTTSDTSEGAPWGLWVRKINKTELIVASSQIFRYALTLCNMSYLGFFVIRDEIFDEGMKFREPRIRHINNIQLWDNTFILLYKHFYATFPFLNK